MCENARTTRALSTSGESPADGRALLREELGNLHAKIDALVKRMTEMERAHEAKIASVRAEHAREMNRSRSDEAKDEPEDEPGNGSADCPRPKTETFCDADGRNRAALSKI